MEAVGPPFPAAADASALALALDARRVLRGGLPEVRRRQRARLAGMVAFARERSPFYRSLYADVPADVTDARSLPVTGKRQLMARFDDWATDREVTFERVRALVEDPARVGERFLGRYTVATTSGTTGTRGLFVIDHGTFRLAGAMMLRAFAAWLGARDLLGILARPRMSTVMATGGHFASAVAAELLRSGSDRRARSIQALSAQAPVPELVEALNAFRPTVLTAYASVAALLAREREAGRLRIDPVLVVLSAEGLPAGGQQRIARAFGCNVRNSYAATECPFLSYDCDEGWQHVNADWVVLEPVDSDWRPVAPGTSSHTVLVTNLANRVQPILRYDLGDSVLERPDPCPCGNPLPAIRVQGRAADVLAFRFPAGARVEVPALALALALDGTPGVDQWQLVQDTPTRVRLRLRVSEGTEPVFVRERSLAAVRRLLERQGLASVEVAAAPEPPVQGAGGKFRAVVPLEEAGT
ncbi:MAG: phenylacetate--CoA ligase family protein [Myxococcota bacterium]